jgi:group I intron endonuclease
MALVYVAMCVPNGKLYFGITVGTLNRRMHRHVSKAHRDPECKFHHALITYGPENFAWEEIGHVESWDDACESERALIRHFDTTRTGYNMTEGGEGSFGFHLTEESKLKLSASVSSTMTPEHRGRLRALKLGTKASLGTRVKQSDAHMGRTRTLEARLKMSEAMQKYSEEFKAEAIAYAEVHGFRAASRKYGPPPITIRRWTWNPEKHEEERLKMLTRGKQRDAANRVRLLAAYSSCAAST